MQHTAAFSSERHDWETPQDFFDAWNREYNFTLDAAASPDNAKVDSYFTKEDDALSQDWPGVVWCNPPYGRKIGTWVEKAYRESLKGATVVMLIPARTETRWWHRYVKNARWIYFMKGRLKFSGSGSNAPFPSAVVVFTPGANPYPVRVLWGNTP